MPKHNRSAHCDSSSAVVEQAPHTFSLDKYIALGCIEVSRAAHTVCDETAPPLSISDSGWTELTTASTCGGLDNRSSTLVASLLRLIDALWIRVFRPVRPSDAEFWRIYVLPHDVGRGQIDRRNKTLQSSVHSLLSNLSDSAEVWSGQHLKVSAPQKFDIWATGEDSSLFYMFNMVPSPDPDPETVENSYMRNCLRRILDKNEDPWGLKTKLYPYQRRSVAMMLQKELAPSMQLDPRFEERQSMTGQVYYYNAHDTLFLASPRYYDTVRGGILAETMGLGKTLICIATILATRGQYPSVPVQYAQPKCFDKVPSLIDAAAAASIAAGTPWRTFFEELQEVSGDQHDECMKVMDAQRPAYELPPRVVRTMRKSSVYGSPESVELCSGTIVVVPPNLVQQWEAELKKHTREGTLRLLVLKDRDSIIPPSDQLRQYDIVLFSRRRFEREVSTTDDLYISPLKDLHWLRIVIDEGQGFSSNSTNAAAVAEKIVRAERRWIVSGTPSKDLLGVEVSLSAMQVSDLEDASQRYRNESLEKRKRFDAQQERASGAARSLGDLASRFLKARPWSMPADDSESAAIWEDYIYRHESFRQRTYTGFSTCFRTTLGHLVVKTKAEDVEKDLLLPPLRHTVTRLAASPIDKMTANLFVLLYTTNAITSERRDQDYLFHSSSRFHLLRLTANLRQSSFFWVGFGADSIRASLDVSERYLNKSEINCSEHDRQLLLDTMEAARSVLKSPVWNALSKTQEMGIFLNDWPQAAKDSWLFPECFDSPVTGLTQVSQAQRHVNRQLALGNPLEGLQEAGHIATNPEEELVHSDVTDQASGPLLMVKNGVPSDTLGDNFRAKAGLKSAKVKASPTKTQAKVDTEAMKTDITPRRVTAANRKLAAESRAIELAPESELGSVRLVGTASAKLSYLMDRVLALQEEEKILIFYDGGHIAYYISQALDLLNVKHLIYANTLSNETRSKYIVLFDTDSSYRVLVMDIKQAARGLNVSSASRVFFVNPPCQPDVEAQAVKRAHRIGQTRPVHVETLVLAGTVEEAIHDRAAKMTQREHSSTKTLEDDENIRSIIQNARALPLRGDELHGEGQMARLEKPQQVFGRPGRSARRAEGLEKEIFGEVDEDLAPRAAKKARARPSRRQRGVETREATPSPAGGLQPSPARVQSLFGG